MSTTSAAMLAQFNQDSPYKRDVVIDSKSDRAFGTWSYANEYDALYQRFSQNRNFNMDMWHQSIKLGEQDQYLAFLEQNKDNELSPQFYDPQYYDYENRMLELYLPFADNTNKVTRYEDVYDNIKGEWVQNNIGDMTEQEYLRYQLDKNYEYKAAEIQRQIEQDRKDSMGWLEKTGHSALATLAELGEGILSGLIGIVDFVLAVGTLGLVPYASAGGKENYLDAFVDYFGQNGLLAAEKKSVRAALDEYERTHTYFRDIDGNMTNAGKYIAGITNSMGMMVPSIVLAYFTGGTSLAFLGFTSFYASIFSSNMYENANNPYIENSPAGWRIFNAAVKTGVEAIIEWGLGKVFGGTIQNSMLGLKSNGLFSKAFLNMGKTAGLKMVAKSAAQEGLEEFLQDFGTNLVDQFMDLWQEGYGNNGVTMQTLCDSFWSGVIMSVFMTGGHIALNSAQSSTINRKAKTYAEMEKAGNLSEKEQAKIKAFKEKHGEYDLETDVGPADLVIEKDGELKKVKGLNKMYLGQILSDMRQAMEDLRTGKVSGSEAIELAQEVYSGLSVMTNYYASFDKKRLEACELLLDRVIKAEESNARKKQSLNEYLKEHPEYEDLAKVDRAAMRKDTKAERTYLGTTETKTFGTIAELAYVEMIGEANTRARTRIRAAAEKKEKELAEGGVKEVKSIIDGAGVRHKGEMATEVEGKLSKKAESTLDEILNDKNYEWIFTVDGHVAVEEGDILFVSEAWLENYSAMEIYKFLEQSRVLNTLLEDKHLQPFIAELVKFYKGWSGKEDAMISPTMALMNFLFNENAYQAFLLSNDGKGAHDHKAMVFDMHNTIKELVAKSGYLNYHGKPSPKRQNLLKLLYNQIKDTWRKPVMKAILVWGFDPSDIGADTILNDTDLKFIEAYRQREKVIAMGESGENAGAYAHTYEDLLKGSDIHPGVTDFLSRVKNDPDASVYDRLTERIILDLLDQTMDDRSPKRAAFDMYMAQQGMLKINESFNNFYDGTYTNLDCLLEVLSILEYGAQVTGTYTSEVKDFVDTYRARAGAGEVLDPLDVLNEYMNFIDTLFTDSSAVSPAKAAFTLPVSVIGQFTGNPAETQCVVDAMREFERLYGVTVQRMVYGDLSSLTEAQINFLRDCMRAMSIKDDDYVQFAIVALEKLLGDEYVVVPIATQRPAVMTESDKLELARDISNDIESLKDDAYALIKLFDIENLSEFDSSKLSSYSDFNNSWARFSSKLITINDLCYQCGFSHELINLYLNAFCAPDWALTIEDKYTTLNEFFADVPTITAAIADWIKTLDVTFAGYTASRKTGYSTVQVVKAIPADVLLSKEFLAEDVKSRDDALRAVMQTRVDKNGVPCAYVRDIMSPDFFDIFSDGVRSRIETIPVYMTLLSGTLGAYDPVQRNITIDFNMTDYVPTLIHELNHMLQHICSLPNGGSPEMFIYHFSSIVIPRNAQLLYHIFEHHFEAVMQEMHMSNPSELYEILADRQQGMSVQQLFSKHSDLWGATSFIAYMLLSGETWARTYMHNGKPIRGYSLISRNDKATDVVRAPDGTEFDMQIKATWSFASKTSRTLPDTLIDVSLVNAIDELFDISAELTHKGYDPKGRIRDTYHTPFRAGKYDSKSIINAITRETMSPVSKMGLNINTIITNPEYYLAEEILERMNGDYSEGNVYWRLREYLEENFSGISIDRRATDNTYVLVNDDSFTDLYNSNTRDCAKASTQTLFDKFADKGGIPLTEIYTNKIYTDLGIARGARIYISTDPKVTTEARIGGKYPDGAIFIHVRPDTASDKFDAVIVQRINHEFRHLLQSLNNFELGFTTAFTVSAEMIAEFKTYLPELFYSEEAKRRAKNRAAARGTNWEEEIVRLFVYRMVSGELNANGISSNILHLKPAYTRNEGGKMTIFLPWYNATTGIGRHPVEIISSLRSESDPTATPAPKKRKHTGMPKYEEPKFDVTDPLNKKSRRISKRRAKGTNLQYFVDAGVETLDPRIQDFVISTTGLEDELPKDLLHAIKTGRLNLQRFNNWFRNVKAGKISERVFDIINSTIYHNEHIDSMAELEKLISFAPAFYWSLARVLRKDNLVLDMYVQSNSTEVFLEFLNSMEGSSWAEIIYADMDNFLKQVTIDGKGTKVDIEHDEKLLTHARTLALKYFDGTLSGAYEFARRYRQLAATMYVDRMRDVESLDREIDKSEGSTTFGDLISTDDVVGITYEDDIGNDISAVYEYEVERPRIMIETLGEAEYSRRLENYLATIENPKIRATEKRYLNDPEMLIATIGELEAKEDRSDADNKKLRALKKIHAVYENLTTDMAVYYDKLNHLPYKDLYHRYTLYDVAIELGTKLSDKIFDLDTPMYVETLSEEGETELRRKGLATDLPRVQKRIKGKANTLLSYLRDGKISFQELPEEAQALFTLKEFVDPDTKRKFKAYVLSEEAYRVGRGPVALPDTGKTHKVDMRDDTEARRHDVSKLIEIDDMLYRINEEVRRRIKARKNGEIITKKALDNLVADNKKHDTKAKGEKLVSVEFAPTPTLPKLRKGTRKRMSTDLPNNFKVEALMDMPDVLKKMLETSFDELAYTKVQFASRDKEGHLYDPEALEELGIDPEDFESLRTHEISNWHDFYEANRAVLINLTRDDAKAIVQYFVKGKPFTIEGPANKLRAYEIFILGYIVDAARNNYHNWNFSKKEIELLEALYELRASEAGSALNAVSQMIAVINPTKQVRAGMFESWETITDEDKTKVINAIDKLGKAKTKEEREAACAEVLDTLKDLENRELASKTKAKVWSKEWFSTLYKDLKSWRYLSMLSSPFTWEKNLVGNIAFLATNYTADGISRLVFNKKQYRKDQWDFNITVSNEIKVFIDEYFLNNELFTSLYGGTRYEERIGAYGNFENSRLITMVTEAYERKYLMSRPFSKEALNVVQGWLEKVMSDGAFVRQATKRYLGKILANEVAKGNVDLSKGLSDNVMAAFAEALLVANEDYMHKRSGLSKMIDSTRDTHPVLYETATLLFPFLNSSWNIFTECLKLSPAGLVHAIYKMATLEKQIALAEQRRAKGISGADSRMTEYLIRRDVGKGVIGLILAIAGCFLAFSGLVGIEEEKGRMKLLVKDIELDVSDIFGSASVLIGIAFIQDLFLKKVPDEHKDREIAYRLEELLRHVTIEMFNGFFLNQLLERNLYSENIYDAFVNETNSFCRSFVPQLFQTAASFLATKKRKFSNTFEGQFERWIYSFLPLPGLGEYVINPYTGEQQTKYAKPYISHVVRNALAKGLVGGAKIYWYEISDNERMCREYEVNKSELTGELTANNKKYQLDAEQVNLKYGELNNAALAKIKSQKHYVEMPNGTYKTLSWDQMSYDQRQNVLSRTMTKNAEYAKIYVWTQMGHKVYVNDSMWQTLRNLGITKNVYKGDKGFVE